MRAIHSARGSTFVLCRLSERNPAFPKYPTVPVVACKGYEVSGSTSPPIAEHAQFLRHLQREQEYWDRVQPDPASPQIWHDPELFELFFGPAYRAFIERAATCGPDVLELGCGEGTIALELARRGCRVTGVDLSPARIRRATEAAAEHGLSGRAVFQTADLNTLTLEPHRYSCILAHDALHHVLNLEHLFLQVRSALHPDGVFLVMDYCGMSLPRKVAAATLYALLPTYKPYREKWKLRTRLKGFLANEHEKRSAIAMGDASSLHPGSPFEEISQSSLPRLLHAMFAITKYETMLPFWFFLAPKLRIPLAMRPATLRLLRAADGVLSTFGITGAYFTLEARIRHAPTHA